jgi:ABC-type antimicrobial peptide transport system permease subunit
MSFFSDVRYAIRALARNPGFAAIVVLVLALGVGGTTAMLTIVDAILLRPLIRQGLPPVIFGLAAGLSAAVAAGRLMNSFLFGVTATDPDTLGAVAALILSVAVAACYIPASRATHADPLTVLRYE